MAWQFDSFSLVQPIDLFKPFLQRFWLAYCSMLYENTDARSRHLSSFGM